MDFNNFNMFDGFKGYVSDTTGNSSNPALIKNSKQYYQIVDALLDSILLKERKVHNYMESKNLNNAITILIAVIEEYSKKNPGSV